MPISPVDILLRLLRAQFFLSCILFFLLLRMRRINGADHRRGSPGRHRDDAVGAQVEPVSTRVARRVVHAARQPQQTHDALVLSQVLSALHQEGVRPRVTAAKHHLLRLAYRRHHLHLPTHGDVDVHLRDHAIRRFSRSFKAVVRKNPRQFCQ